VSTLMDGSILRALGVEIARDEQRVARPIPAGGHRPPLQETVHICAWCDWDKTQTRALLALGRRVSHTICREHGAQQLERARELNQAETQKLRREAA